MKQHLRPGVLLTVIISIVVLWVSSNRNRAPRFDPVDLPKTIALPLFYERMPAKALEQEGRYLLEKEGYSVPTQPQRDHFLCASYLDTPEGKFYLMELDGTLYAQEAGKVEPVIHALYHIHRGQYGTRPETVAATITELPDDPAERLDLVKRLKKVAIP